MNSEVKSWTFFSRDIIHKFYSFLKIIPISGEKYIVWGLRLFNDILVKEYNKHGAYFKIVSNYLEQFPILLHCLRVVFAEPVQWPVAGVVRSSLYLERFWLPSGLSWAQRKLTPIEHHWHTHNGFWACLFNIPPVNWSYLGKGGWIRLWCPQGNPGSTKSPCNKYLQLN